MLANIINLKNNKGFVKYFKNTSWMMVEKLVRMLLGLFVGVWVARYLEPENFGLLSYAQSFVSLFAVIATLGLDSIVIKELVNNQSKRDKLLGSAFILKLLGAILVFVLFLLFIEIKDWNDNTDIFILIISIGTVFQSFNVINFYFNSIVKSKYVVLSNLISITISSGLKVIFILNEAPLIAFVYLTLLDNIIIAVCSIYFYVSNNMSIRNWSFDICIAKSLIMASWPLILTGLVISIYMKIDLIMIKYMLGDSFVGQYSAAVRLSELWYFIPIAISTSLYPAIINAKKNSKELYYSRLQKLYDLMAWLAILIALPMTFLSDWVINLLYGVEYDLAGSVLMIHIWTSVFVFLGVASSKWFIVEGLQIYSFYRTLCGAIFNVILNFFLIPQFGIYGAAIATLVSQVIASYLFNIINKKTRLTFVLQTKALLLPIRKLGFY